MPTVSISDLDYTLRKVIAPHIVDNFTKETILLDLVKKSSDLVFINKNFYIPVASNRHVVTPLASDTAKLVSGKREGVQASAAVTELTGTFDISELAIKVSEKSEGAIKADLVNQAEGMTVDFGKGINRIFWGDGKGVIAVADGNGTNSTSLTVQYGGGVISVNNDIDPTEYITKGANIKIGSAAAVLVTGVNTTTNVVTLAAQRSWSDDDNIVLCDGDGTQGVEAQGVTSAVDTDADYLALTRATTPGWTVAYTNISSEAFSMDRLHDAYLKARKRGSAKDRYAIIMNQTPYKKYGDLLAADKRFTPEKELLGGWEGLAYAAGSGRVGVYLDYDCPDGQVFVLNLDKFIIGQVGEAGWVEDPQGSLIRRSDYITYQAVMRWYAQFMCSAPCAQSWMSGKTA